MWTQTVIACIEWMKSLLSGWKYSETLNWYIIIICGGFSFCGFFGNFFKGDEEPVTRSVQEILEDGKKEIKRITHEAEKSIQKKQENSKITSNSGMSFDGYFKVFYLVGMSCPMVC